MMSIQALTKLNKAVVIAKGIKTLLPKKQSHKSKFGVAGAIVDVKNALDTLKDLPATGTGVDDLKKYAMIQLQSAISAMKGL